MLSILVHYRLKYPLLMAWCSYLSNAGWILSMRWHCLTEIDYLHSYLRYCRKTSTNMFNKMPLDNPNFTSLAWLVPKLAYHICLFTHSCPNRRAPLFLNRLYALRTWRIPCYFCILWHASGAKCEITWKIPNSAAAACLYCINGYRQKGLERCNQLYRPMIAELAIVHIADCPGHISMNCQHAVRVWMNEYGIWAGCSFSG